MENPRAFSLEHAIDHVRLLRIAQRLGRYFPPHLLSVEDLIQEEWVGILEVRALPEESEEQFLIRCYQAAWRQAVDALRRFRLMEKRGVRQLEVLVDNIDTFERGNWGARDNRDIFMDFMVFFKKLPERSQLILYGVLHEIPLARIGEKLNLTEGRISQIKTEIFQSLKEDLNASW